MDAATIVRRVRALSGINSKQLSELADLSPSTVSRIERGMLDPTWGTLTQILDATGYQINGDTVVSAGDPSAIAAARSVLQPTIERSESYVSLDSKLSVEIGQWLERWTRAGWLSPKSDADDMVTLAVSAGNAGKMARRNVERRVVVAEDGWRVLARQLGVAGIDYAVSGLVAARDDRSTATSVNPIMYVEDPSRVIERLNLTETKPGEGVLLIESRNDELEGTQSEGDIRFASRTQGILDAFAGPGREPDKAEDTLRHLLSVSA